jgi:hypothetical protein
MKPVLKFCHLYYEDDVGEIEPVKDDMLILNRRGESGLDSLVRATVRAGMERRSASRRRFSWKDPSSWKAVWN